MNNLAKFELELVLSNILSKYGFLDRISIKEYVVDSLNNNITGIFKHCDDAYGYCLSVDDQKNVESIKWSPFRGR